MQLKMSQNSLFAVLLRSPAWISFAVAGGVFALAQLFLPSHFAVIVPLPFFVIGAMAAWRQWRTPSAARAAETLAGARAMSWPDFAAAVEAGYRRDGYSVGRPARAGAADFEVIKAGKVTLVAAKRWKVAQAGVEPLKDLAAMREAAGAQSAVYIAAGDVTDNARAFAKANGIALLEGVPLAQFLVALVKPAARGVRAG